MSAVLGTQPVHVGGRQFNDNGLPPAAIQSKPLQRVPSLLQAKLPTYAATCHVRLIPLQQTQLLAMMSFWQALLTQQGPTVTNVTMADRVKLPAGWFTFNTVAGGRDCRLAASMLSTTYAAYRQPSMQDFQWFQPLCEGCMSHYHNNVHDHDADPIGGVCQLSPEPSVKLTLEVSVWNNRSHTD